MKSALWQNFLLLVMLPFMTLFCVLLAYILFFAYEERADVAGRLLRDTARFNEAHLKRSLESVYLTAKAAAAALERVDTSQPNARRVGEQTLQRMLTQNNLVFNAWLAYEPNAFDGRDAEDRDGYPGAPSGRFIRSYSRNREGMVVMIPDMDETTLDNPLESYWYTNAVQRARDYIDINDGLIYDYKDGSGPVSSYSVVIPLFKDGKVVGCVGADGRIMDILFFPDNKATSVLFSDDMKLTAAPGIAIEDARKDMGEMGFSHWNRIQEAFRTKQPLFLERENINLSDMGASMISFEPVTLEAFGETVWVAAILPLNTLYRSMIEMFLVTLFAILLFGFFFFWLSSYVTRIAFLPLRFISEVTKSFDFQRASILKPQENMGEIGWFVTSFYQMLEKLKCRHRTEEWPKKMLDFHLFVEDLLTPDSDLAAFFQEFAPRARAVFGADWVSLRLRDRETGALNEVFCCDATGVKKGTNCAQDWEYLLTEADNALLPVWLRAGEEGQTEEGESAEIVSLKQANLPSPFARENESGEKSVPEACEKMMVGASSVCAMALRTKDGLRGGIFFAFSGAVDKEIERHAAFLAEVLTHRLTGRDLRME
jgi:hypothetical protein